MNLAAVIAALQSYVSQHPRGGAACILLPANDKSITRNDFRAIAQVEVRDEEVVIAKGKPIFTRSGPERRNRNNAGGRSILASRGIAQDIRRGRRPLTLRLPANVIDRWKATGPGWQTRMAERLSKSR